MPPPSSPPPSPPPPVPEGEWSAGRGYYYYLQAWLGNWVEYTSSWVRKGRGWDGRCFGWLGEVQSIWDWRSERKPVYLFIIFFLRGGILILLIWVRPSLVAEKTAAHYKRHEQQGNENSSFGARYKTYTTDVFSQSCLIQGSLHKVEIEAEVFAFKKMKECQRSSRSYMS